MQIDNPKGISIGDNVGIFQHAWLMGSKENRGGLSVGNRTTIGHFVHIVALKEVRIGNDVLIADRVFISDCTHSYTDIGKSVQDQPVKYLQSISVGDESWIGENVCICGANIGKHCVIGANSVVLKDIPDYCVAAGNPAKVIKRYDFTKEQWIKCDE